MRFNYFKSALTTASFVTILLLLGVGVSNGQVVNLTAAASTATLPDGNPVPMWGYSCKDAGSNGASCAAANPGASWSPVVITVAPGPLTINLTNNLSFSTGSGTNSIPTSLTIVGQLGGGLGGSPTRTPSPQHAGQTVTWSTLGAGAFTPPPQADRVRTFGTEVATGATTTLTWAGLKPGTYLIESGTHPSIQGPMGLYGILIVTNAPTSGAAGTAYTGVSYDADVPMLLSEIDPAQNAAVAKAVTTAGFSEDATANLQANGAVVSVGLLSGGSGYTSAPTVVFSGSGGASATATVSGGSVTSITLVNAGNYTSQPTITFSGGGGSGANAAAVLANQTLPTCITSSTCYPPVVNYDPRYYLVNGVAFSSTNASKSFLNLSTATAVSNNVLVRFVNAGVRMHVPSIVGAQVLPSGSSTRVPGFALIAEDGNPLPGIPRIQNEVFLSPGKTFDVMISPALTSPATSPATYAAATLPMFDRQLSLSTNNTRDGGMHAFIQINGGGTGLNFGPTSAPSAVAGSYYCIPGVTLSVADPSLGVLKGLGSGAFGATLDASSPAPVHGTISLNPDGTFTYTQPAANTTCGDTFVYDVNGQSSDHATVTISQCQSGMPCWTGPPNANNQAYVSNIASRFQLGAPGVLLGDIDPGGHPLTAALTGTPTGGSVTVNPDGSFTAIPGTLPTGSGTATVTFQYNAVNSQKAASTTPGTVTVTFNGGSGLQVNVHDSPTGSVGVNGALITDYRWIIEEDRTFHVDQNAVNTGAPVPSLGTNFHTSYMPVVAAGCVGTYACETGQTVFDPSSGSHVPTVCDLGDGACETGSGAGSQQVPVDPKYVHLDSTKHYYISILPGDAGNSFTYGGGAPISGSATGLSQAKGSTTVTANIGGPPAGINVGDVVQISGSSDPNFNGNWPVLSVGPNGFTFKIASTAGGTDSGASYGRQFSISEDCGAYTTTNTNWQASGSGKCGHSMGGAPIPPSSTAVNVLLQETPFQPAKVSVFVYEDDFPLNGENDAGGGVDILAPIEPGLDGFEIRLWDDAGGTGDATGQMTYDMFNEPLSNSLSGTIDPATGLNACPISPTSTDGLVGMIVTCPKYEQGGKILSPLAGQAVIANLMPGRYGVMANPGADRIGRGEEWLQTNTLDGQKAHDAFIKVGGPAYFQEFGPAGFHVSIGFANPAIINARKPAICTATGDGFVQGSNCVNEVKGTITDMRQSHPPDQRLYSSGTRDALSFTQCYVSLGDPDGEDFAFTKCDANGHFDLTGLPDGDWRITVFDQWNDQIVDGLSTPVRLNHTMTTTANGVTSPGQVYDFGGGSGTGGLSVQQWHTNVATQTYFDRNGNGIRDSDEDGLALAPTNIRFRDGSYSNFNNTDLNGYANFNEEFPLFNWYVIDTDETRYKQTGVHVVYDAGGPADGTPGGGSSNIGQFVANTVETNGLPTALRVPGAYYCSDADCSAQNGKTSVAPGGSGGSTGRIDPPWVTTEGWQGFIGEYEFIQFGKQPFNPGENGGIRGEVVYASTRPFDDPAMLVHTSWTPDVPGVTINLYQEGTAADGTKSLTLVDTTKTTSWDDWAQGVRPDGNPNMNCPGQAGSGTQDLFYFTLFNTTTWLDAYYNGASAKPLPNNSQFKCYDGLHNFNQVQPAPYDGAYKFPSRVLDINNLPTLTHCTICTGKDSNGLPMLPAGKYVVEMIVPPGYELVKEEDKNILIGDNYIAPVTQQFGGIGNIFILPDQAEVSGQYNPNNPQNPTNNLGSTPRTEGDTHTVEEKWPCVGQARIVPDYISLFPWSNQVSPFAGATRNLCDRKEITLDDQRSAVAKFWVFSSTHVAAHFTGFILDDLSSEFDPFAPQFGEKFAVPNLPISIKDFAGNEVLRTYTDQWGVYNGLNYSTWEVNPPNPTGYAPTMMVACMNDPGNGPTPDPKFNPAYSQFCYEIPYMPGQTQYMDTPVVPTAAFAEGYNPPDCAYPDTTPAVSEVDGDKGVGPYVSAAGVTLTIKALGAKQVPNPAYMGPSATSAPYNQLFVTRNYTFGNTKGTVTIGGLNAPVTGWSDGTITVTVPSGLPACAQSVSASNHDAVGSYGRCGQLVITNANGKQSIDAITVTVGGKAPTYVTGENASSNAVQLAIDAATPGDLIIVEPGTYNEMLLMWKPVRLQGVGAASSIINANTHPSGKLDPWRRQVNCLFGLAVNGSLLKPGGTGTPNTVPYDPTNQFTCSSTMQGAVDPLPLEGIVGWDTTLNGNLAELLQEPSLMGAYEGAAVTVLGKGMNLSIDASGGGTAGTEGDFPTGARVLTNSSSDCSHFVSNFLCAPSSIDGLTLSDSSQGGGGIFVHAWNHYLQIANDRVLGNAGTLSGGINVGQGESTDPTFDANNVELPFLYDMNVNVHNNSITGNSSYGDELFSATPSAAGGITFCTGADYYKFNYNWLCGNLSTGDGGGLAHEGFIKNGNIAHNWVLFNQSNNISIPTNGGGIVVLGAAPDGTPPGAAPGTECGSVTDVDCAPGLSDGTGPGLVIDSNVIIGNTAESGSGGGIRLQTVNGTEVTRFPNRPDQWYDVTVTNNIIANNVAGWDGGGVSLQDALKVNLINNTIVANDTTASAGSLFNTVGAPQASTPPPTCTAGGVTVVCTAPQPAGLVTMQNTSNLTGALLALPANTHVVCPAGHPNCTSISYPLLENNLFWQNRYFHIQDGGTGTGNLSQQNIVTLMPALSQATTGACVTGATYWDLGVRGDTGPSDHSSSITLSPTYSILTPGSTGYNGVTLHNQFTNPNVADEYCNGSRVPPENGGMGYIVPPGISDATAPNPVFNLTAGATVDEGNNWINMIYGPLSLQNPTLTPGVSPTTTPGTSGGNYELTAQSTAAIGAIPQGTGNYSDAPSVDLLGTPRKTDHKVDIGAIEFVGTGSAVGTLSGGPLSFGNVVIGSTSASQTLTLSNTGGASLTGITVAVTAPFTQSGGSCTGTLTAGSTCTITVVFSPTALGPAAGTVTVNANVPVSGSPAGLSGTGVARGTVSIVVNPATITLPHNGVIGAATVTLTNTSPAGGASVTVSGIAVAGGAGSSAFGWTFFTAVGGDHCTGAVLAPGGTCTVTVDFSSLLATRGVTRSGTITFTDNATGSPQAGALKGFATP